MSLKVKLWIVNSIEWLLDIILDSLVPYRFLARFKIEKAKVSRAFYFDYVINQKLQRIQLLHRIRSTGETKPQQIKAWWSRGLRNFGDELTAYILAEIAALDCVFDRSKAFVAIGSVIRFANDSSTVWGSGIIRHTERIDARPTCLAVRGPITRARLLSQGTDCPEVYGDPVMLLPLFYQPKFAARKTPVLIAPHFKQCFLHNVHSNLDYLDVHVSNIADIEACIDKICSANNVITSSLHVFIVCVAFGVPVTVFQLDGFSIGGDNIKFDDFCYGVSMEPVKIYNVLSFTEKTVHDLAAKCELHATQWSPTPLLRALYNLYPTDRLAHYINKE